MPPHRLDYDLVVANELTLKAVEIAAQVAHDRTFLPRVVCGFVFDQMVLP